jgi:hypothetical protein
MLQPPNINPREVLLIAEIERNETWFLGERVGHAVDPQCQEVVSRVVEIVLQYAAQWRTILELDGATTINPGMGLPPPYLQQISHLQQQTSRCIDGDTNQPL